MTQVSLLPSALLVDSKLKAVEQAQTVVNIELGIRLRNSTKQRRDDLDEALLDHDDVIRKVSGG